MKQQLITLFLTAFLSSPALADAQLEHKTFHSQLLTQQSKVEKADRELFVYLPDGYQDPGTS